MAVPPQPTIFCRAAARRNLEQLLRQMRGQRQRQQQSRAHSSGPGGASPKSPSQTAAEGQARAQAQQTQIPTPGNVPILPFWQRLGPLTRAAEAYGRSQRKRPYTTQFITSLVIYLCSDISAQSLQRDTYKDPESTFWETYSPARTMRALTIGAISSIPSYKWFLWLSSSFNFASSQLLSLFTKVVVNQICFTPIFNTYFFGMQALLAGENLETTWERVRVTVPVSFVNSCKVWPAVTAFSFAFIPLEYRSIFAGVVAVGWQSYLSLLNRKAEEAEAAAEASVPASVVATPKQQQQPPPPRVEGNKVAVAA